MGNRVWLKLICIQLNSSRDFYFSAIAKAFKNIATILCGVVSLTVLLRLAERDQKGLEGIGPNPLRFIFLATLFFKAPTENLIEKQAASSLLWTINQFIQGMLIVTVLCRKSWLKDCT